jgi:hypothetical protein
MAQEHACCPGAEWNRVADLGHAGGTDCVLVRCSICRRPWAHLWTPFARDAGYSALDDATAQELAVMPAGPERNRRLRDIFDL